MVKISFFFCSKNLKFYFDFREGKMNYFVSINFTNVIKRYNWCSKNCLFLVVVGAFLVEMFLGANFAFNFDLPRSKINSMNVSDTAKNFSREIDGVPQTPGLILWYHGLPFLAMSTSMGLGGYISLKIHPILTVFCGCCLTSLGIIVYTFYTNIWIYLILYATVGGIGAGIAFSVSMSIPCQFFSRFEGLTLGLILSGFPLGFVISQQYMHENLNLNKLDTSDKIPYIGVLFIPMQIIGCLLMYRKRPDDETISVLNWREDINVRPHNLIFEFDFWILWITFSLNEFNYFLFGYLYPLLPEDEYVPINSNFANSYVYHFLNAFGRIFWGFLIDQYSYRLILTWITLGSTLCGALFIFCHHSYSYVLCLHNFWNVAYIPVIAATVYKRFGKKYFASNFSLMWTSFAFAAFVTCCCGDYMIKDLMPAKLTFTVMSFMSFLLTQFYLGSSRRYRWLF